MKHRSTIKITQPTTSFVDLDQSFTHSIVFADSLLTDMAFAAVNISYVNSLLHLAKPHALE